MQKVFLDIGAHTGETLAEVIRPLYGFDRIIAFEPSSHCAAALEALAAADGRIELCRFGLGDGPGELVLRGSGLDSATTLVDGVEGDVKGGEAAGVEGALGAGAAAAGGPNEIVRLEDASDWVRTHLRPDDLIIAKLNCEGGEVAILRSWIRSGLIARFYSVMITFDIRNFPALRHQEGELRAALRRLGHANTCFADDVMIGPTHQQRIAHWLTLFGLEQPSLCSLADYRRAYARPLKAYAARRGLRQRAELILKERFGYGTLPAPAKALLRRFKARLGLSSERALRGDA